MRRWPLIHYGKVRTQAKLGVVAQTFDPRTQEEGASLVYIPRPARAALGPVRKKGGHGGVCGVGKACLRMAMWLRTATLPEDPPRSSQASLTSGDPMLA